MKITRWVGIIILVLIILLLAIALIHFIFPKPAQTTVINPVTGQQAKTPSDYAGAFYAWYLQNVERDPAFPRPDTVNTTLSPWLTQKFIDNWSDLIAQEDTDPVLLAQDSPMTWGSG